LLAEMSGEFKMILSSQPGPNFKIKLILPRLHDGFIVADESGKFKIYQSTGDPKSPYGLYMDLPTAQDIDEPWSSSLQKLDFFPYFPIVGAFV
jgi:hypothetical protein